ncbi:MAG: hypothetical protein QHD01_05915 [Bradyrhizobium sp.]|uniref:hypothetical protein n=1 Tax=Bradyrhizobium sp. TaxID=376 RepID=UPI0029BD612F|nr:hypothetical protein [Bradyrhizobium sp.]MDX3966121.1 hypothetical protein [Bradyrhizobium sp.]
MSAFPFKTRFMETTRGQCMFFLPGESGREGFVCGAPTERSYCDCHHKATHQPLKKGNVFFLDASSSAAPDDTDHEPDLTEVLQ